MVIYDLSLEPQDDFLLRGEWEKQAQTIQSQFVLIGIDAIGYVHMDDWNASKGTKESYKTFFALRQVSQIIKLSDTEDRTFKLAVLSFPSEQELWSTEAGSINQAIFRLGQKVKTDGFVLENFLPAETAEIFVDIPFAQWSASNNYPDRLRRLTLGVPRLPNEEENEQLIRILDAYPYEYELFDYRDDEDAFRQGYQYILQRMTSAGSSVKKLLNYQTIEEETDYISTVKGEVERTELKTIPVDARITKFYIRQTVTAEVHVGTEWDADTDWQSALANYLNNLRIAFRLNP